MNNDPAHDPWIENWPKEEDKARYRFHAGEVYEQFKSYRDISFKHHVEYAKWLLATLLAVHGGSIYAISSIRNSVNVNQIEGLITGAGWNLAGIAFTLLTGFCAWLNFQFATAVYDEWADPAMMYRDDMWPADKKDKHKTNPVGATLFLGAAFGLMSAFCFVVSAIGVISTLKIH